MNSSLSTGICIYVSFIVVSSVRNWISLYFWHCWFWKSWPQKFFHLSMNKFSNIYGLSTCIKIPSSWSMYNGIWLNSWFYVKSRTRISLVLFQRKSSSYTLQNNADQEHCKIWLQKIFEKNFEDLSGKTKKICSWFDVKSRFNLESLMCSRKAFETGLNRA